MIKGMKLTLAPWCFVERSIIRETLKPKIMALVEGFQSRCLSNLTFNFIILTFVLCFIYLKECSNLSKNNYYVEKKIEK